MADSDRPILKLPLTPFDLSVEVLGLLALIGFWQRPGICQFFLAQVAADGLTSVLPVPYR